MPLKAKLILLSLVPLLLVTVSISWIAIYQAKTLGDREVAIFHSSLIKSKETALKDSVDLAFDAISHVYNDPDLDTETAQQEVKSILTKLRYGKDGYFFAYDTNGLNLVHPILPELVGQNLHELQDSNGDYLIQELLHAAQSGGGYHQYLWQKPSSGETVLKLSYAAWLDKWGWMIGTGLYIEDVHTEIATMQTAINDNIETTFFSLIVILIVTVAVILVITLAINLHEHKIADRSLKELAHKTVMFQEDEKKYLARELHDGINQLLVSSKCHLDLLGHKIQEDGLKVHVDKSLNSLTTAINEVRHISHKLRPSALDDIGLEAALNSLLQDYRSHSGVELEILLSTQPGKLKSEVATTLYRVVQESITNIEKHASASKVTVSVQQMGNMLQLLVRDDGVGFHPSEALRRNGIGLRNMRERVEFIGGDFELLSEPGFGTEITVLLKLDGLVYGSPISVVIVDDHQVVLDGFIARLELESDIEVIGTASNGVEAVEVVNKFKPDVVLMDVSMPIMNGIEATALIKEEHPEVRVLMLTMHDNREYIMKVMQAGAVGYMLKDISAEKMVQAIKTVNQGSTYFCESVTQTLFTQEIAPAAPKSNPLSRREESVLKMVAQGHSSKKIASLLDISYRTVETHRQNIKHKLDLHSTAQLATYAVENGLVD